MLTDVEIRKAKAKDKAYKLYDSGGLFMQVTTAGSKLWRMKFVKDGKEKLLSFGAYPDVTLLAARKKRDEARDELRDGHDPTVRVKVKRAAIATDEQNTFEAMAKEWALANQKRWVKDHHRRVLRCLEIDVFPKLGGVPIKDIKPPHVLEIIRKVEKRGKAITAHLVRQRMSAVFVYAIATGRAEMDPAAPLKAVMTPAKSRKQPAVTTIEQARMVLAACERVPGNPMTKLCMRFLALTSTRPVETRGARWEEFELDETGQPIWRIPAERMKMRREHVVPLSRQAVEVLYAVREFVGERRFVFPGERHITEPVGESTLLDILNRAGFNSRHVPHGWRSTFSTVMNDRYPLEPHIIDAMLAHAPSNQVESRYNRAEYVARRRELAQEWADLLMDGAKPALSLGEIHRKARTDAVFRRLEKYEAA